MVKLEVYNNGRRRKKKYSCLGLGSWSNSGCSNNYSCYSSCQLILFFLFIFLYFNDVIFSSIGLITGRWLHYNPIGVNIYHSLTLFGFIIFRIIIFYILYKIIFWKYFIFKKFALLFSIYIYNLALLWDFHSFNIINVLDFPKTIVDFHYWINYQIWFIISKILGG